MSERFQPYEEIMGGQEPALWTPSKREEYEHYPEPKNPEESMQREHKLAMLREAYQKTIEAYVDAYAREAPKAKLGATLAKNFVRIYQTTGDINQPGSLRYQAMTRRLERDQAQLRKFLPEEGQSIISGAMSEFTIADTLAHPQLYSAEVYFPDESPGNYEEGKGVDWWVDMSNEVDEQRGEKPYAVALQIKSVPFSPEGLADLNYQVVYPVRTSEELDNVIDFVIQPNNLVEGANIQRLQEKIYRSMNSQLKMQNEYANVSGALVVVPTPDTKASFVHSSTGRLMIDNPLTNPQNSSYNDFWDQLREVTPLDLDKNKVYNS